MFNIEHKQRMIYFIHKIYSLKTDSGDTMKNFLTSLSLLLSLLVSGFASAQTADEILAKHFEAIGQENLLNVQSITTSGKFVQGGMEIPFNSFALRPNKVRVEGSFQGLKFIQAYNGEIGWALNPFMGDTVPTQAQQDIVDELKDQADIDGLFYNYSEKGFKVELVATEDMEGQQVYLLKLTKSNGNEYTYYMDAENFVPLKMKAKVKVMGVEREVETFYSNYKPTEGIVMAYSMESKVGGQTISQIVIDKVEFNKEIDPTIFEMESAKNKD